MFVELDEDGSGQARGGDGWESKGPWRLPWRPQKIAGLMIPRLLNPYFCGGGMLGGGWLIGHIRNTQNATMLAGWGKFWSFARLIHYKATTWVRLLSFNPVCQIILYSYTSIFSMHHATTLGKIWIIQWSNSRTSHNLFITCRQNNHSWRKE